MSHRAARPVSGVRLLPPLLLALALLLPGRAVLLAQAPAGSPRLPDDPRVHRVQIPGSVPQARPAAVILPTDYDDGTHRYPVLYLLHGLGGSWVDWLTRTNILEYTRTMPLIVVLPDAGDSWYVNSSTDAKQRFQDYVGNDVVRWTDANFRTLPYPQARYIAGLSMGGYGALRLATLSPRRFSFAASLSGAFTPVRTSDHPSVLSAFGAVGDSARAAGDYAALLREVKTEPLPYVYLACGTGDGLIDGNREIAAVLSERGIPYEYHETHGVHEWEFWDREIRPVLRRIAQIA